MTRPPWILLLPLLLLGAGPAPAAAADGLELQIIPDAWPSRPRVIGYEYNQKNHHDAPDFIGRKGGAPPLTPVTQKGRRYRLVGVRLVNPAVEERQIKIRSPQFRRGKKVPATVPPEGSVSRYLVVREPDDLRLRVEILDRQGATLIARELLLPEKGRSTRRPSEALAIARELEREDLERRLLATRPVRVTVFDDLELPVPAAHLVLLLDGGMMVYEGDTGEEGAWEGRVIPGAYRVFALAEVPDRTDRELRTAVTKLPRLLALEGRLGPAERELRLAPQRAITVRVADVDHRPIEPRRLWITPAPFLEAYRYELIASRLRGRARIDSTRNNAGGRLLLLASPFPLEVALHAEADAGLEVFLRGQVLAEATRLEMIFDPAHSGRVILDPMTGAGPGSRAEGRLVAVDGAREGIPLDTEELLSLYLSPGRYRVQLRHHLASGGYAEVAPFLTEVRARETVDLTPRLPFDLALYFKRKDRKFQFWLAVTDAAGRVFSGVPGAGGRLLGILDGRAAIDQKLGSLRWELVERLLGIDLQKLSYQVELPFGEERIRGAAHLERTTVYNADGSSGDAPGVLGSRVLALLPEVKRSIDGCWEALGLPDGLRRLHMEFDIFLPPGVGGLGGGGRITLDANTLFPFTCGTDPLPGAYRHELGHNLGFGHDPYMLLSPSGVDEARFGIFGYRMLHADDFQRALSYLERSRQDEEDPWSPGAGVFAALRLLHGPDIHRRMIEERRASEQTLRLYGLSSIERIATLYSLVLDRNVAWIFRSHGWPVFDDRVDLGGSAVRIRKKHPKELNYQRILGTPISSWWVLGPVTSAGESPMWRRVEWPERLVTLDENRPPTAGTQRYLLFRRIVLPQEVEAQILCASDVQLEIRVNGSPTGSLDASPQYSQPVHDELMLNQKRPFAVHLYRGENLIEVAANQPPGSRGFLLELITAEGKGLPFALDGDGPDDEERARKLTRVRRGNAVLNGSFELGSRIPVAWTRGPVEPRRGITVDVDREVRASGKGSLRLELERPARGAVIQRVAVPSDRRYRLTAKVRTEELKGEAYVSFFTGDVHSAQGKTEPVRLPSSRWRSYEARWFSGTSRVVYIACYLKGESGTVWFDDVELVEIP